MFGLKYLTPVRSRLSYYVTGFSPWLAVSLIVLGVAAFLAFIVGIYYLLGWLGVITADLWLGYLGKPPLPYKAIWIGAGLIALVPKLGQCIIPVYLITYVLVSWVL